MIQSPNLNFPRTIRNAIFFVTPFLLVFSGAACSFSTVETYPLPSCYEASDQLSVTINGIDVPVIRNTNIYDYSSFSFSGAVEIEITASENIHYNSISPLKHEISTVVDGNKLRFKLEDPLYLIIKINGLRELVLAADALEEDVPPSSGKNIYNITSASYGADSSGRELSTSAIQSAIDDANAAEGGTVYVPNGVYYTGSLILKSNVELYLQGGAVIRGTGKAKDYEKKYHKNSLGMDGTWFIYTEPESSNIKIYGRGTIDGNGLEMRLRDKFLNNLILPLQTTNFTLDGIICRDSGLWGVIPTRSENIIITNTKHFNENDVAHENDAVDINESQNVKVIHTIMISEDDTFSTKTWDNVKTDIAANWPGSPEVVENVVVDDCVAWSRCATFKIGFGSFQPQSNITIKNSTSYKSMRALGVNLIYGDGDVLHHNITFENIEIEGYWPREGSGSQWLDIFTHANGGPIRDIVFKDINIRQFGANASTIEGNGPMRMVENIRFENIRVPGGQEEYAKTLSAMNIKNVNSYAKELKIIPSLDRPSINLAQGKPVQVSTTKGPENKAEYAVDGNRITKWWSEKSDAQPHLTIDLQGFYNIEQVTIQWGDGLAKDYEIQISDSFGEWKPIKTIEENNYRLNEFYSLSGHSRYLRIVMVSEANDRDFTISHIEVYGTPVDTGNM